MSCSRKFQPLATSTPNSKSMTESAVNGAAVNEHVSENDDIIKGSGRVELSEKRTVNRRVLSSGWLLTDEEKLLLFKICNGRPVT